MKVQRFLDFKLGEYKGYHLKFHFFSTNQGKSHWGMSKKVSLILDNAKGVKKLRKNLSEEKLLQ